MAPAKDVIRGLCFCWFVLKLQSSMERCMSLLNGKMPHLVAQVTCRIG